MSPRKSSSRRADASSAGAPRDLRCEYLEGPLAIGERRPRLSWRLDDPRRGAGQSAYRVIVSTDPANLAAGRGDAWDSGRVRSDQSVGVEYAGRRLRSRTRYHWRVMTFDAHGRPSPWSKPSFFETGLLSAGEWRGSWVGGRARDPGKESLPCPFLRREFSLRPGVARARAYVTARGLFELHVNGRRVGEDRFTPGWTDYRKRIPYRAYDVTPLLRAGANAAGIILGDGWFCGNLGWGKDKGVWGKTPSALAMMIIDYADGSADVIATGPDWRVSTGPILSSDIYNGEVYDARREMPGWAEPGFDDSSWARARVCEPPAAALVAAVCEPVREEMVLRPVAVSEPSPGCFVYDLGQNMVGWARIRVRGPAGARVRIRHAEVLTPDGNLYTANLRRARATDEYTLAGRGVETWEPRFTFHGFRYVELTGLRSRPAAGAVCGVVLHSGGARAGEFECSSSLVNRLQSNIAWGQRGNFLEAPTDCPQRDERLGWTGDAQVFCRTACFNMDVAAFFTKWADDLEDSQHAGGAFPDVVPDILTRDAAPHGTAAWADAGLLVPWRVHLSYGDTRILERHYRSMSRWIDFMRRTSRGLIRPAQGYGDWLSPDASTPGGAPTPKDLIGTAFFAGDCAIMARVAARLGRRRDAGRFAGLFRRVRSAFNREFVAPSGRLAGDTQTGYALALWFDLLPERLRAGALQRLVADIRRRDWHLATGFVGTALLMPVLARFGRDDVARKLLLQETYPSWLFTVKKGATTMWERWNSIDEVEKGDHSGMNSFNHYAYGAVGEWIYARIGGIDLDPGDPGYRTVVVAPQPGGGIDRARARLLTGYGEVRTDWRIDGKRFRLSLTVPPNSRARVSIPAKRAANVTEGGRALGRSEGITRVRSRRGVVEFEAAAGSYVFEAPAPRGGRGMIE